MKHKLIGLVGFVMFVAVLNSLIVFALVSSIRHNQKAQELITHGEMYYQEAYKALQRYVSLYEREEYDRLMSYCDSAIAENKRYLAFAGEAKREEQQSNTLAALAELQETKVAEVELHAAIRQINLQVMDSLVAGGQNNTRAMRAYEEMRLCTIEYYLRFDPDVLRRAKEEFAQAFPLMPPEERALAAPVGAMLDEWLDASGRGGELDNMVYARFEELVSSAKRMRMDYAT